MPKRIYPKTDYPTLQKLSERVNETEQALGKATEVVALPKSTGVTFDGGPPPDTTVAIVRNTAPKPPNAEKDFEGTAWDSGSDVDVDVYRVSMP